MELDPESKATRAYETSVDRDGGMLLPTDLRDRAGMRGKVWLRCFGDHAELTAQDPLAVYEVPEEAEPQVSEPV